MKEKTACIIGVIIAIALTYFTYTKLVPVEAFTALAGAAGAWLFKTVEEIRRAKR